MVRYKGARKDWHTDRDFPYQVEMEVPETGLGVRLDAMLAFCRGLKTKSETRTVDRDPDNRARHAMRWCFADAESADAFQAQFGGVRLTVS